MIEVGDKVKIRKNGTAKNNSWWFNAPFQRKFIGKVGTVVGFQQVTPSKRCPDGMIIRVKFMRYNKQTKKIGITCGFPTMVVDKLEKVDMAIPSGNEVKE